MEGKMRQVNSQTTRDSGINEFAKLSAEIHNVIGTCYADEEKYSEALQNFNRAIELNPNDVKSYFNRGTIRIKLGDFHGARDDFRNAHKLNVS
jgi:Flp pilus assembly protein TadD